MAETPSTMLPLGTLAPGFSLPDADGRFISYGDYENANGRLVMFLCNHCPYVIHIQNALAEMGREFLPKNIVIFAVNANDAEKYPADSPTKMKETAERVGYPFFYLYDATQEVAKAYRAACTPDFFLFNKENRLVYRGQFDDARPGNQLPITGRDLKNAMNALLEGKAVSLDQKPSRGCNIKWKPGNEPDYFASPSSS